MVMWNISHDVRAAFAYFIDFFTLILPFSSQDHQLRWWFELAPPGHYCDSA